MIVAAVTGAAIVGVAVAGTLLGFGHAVELAKEFGGGYAAYWTHHVFHKVWSSSGKGKHHG